MKTSTEVSSVISRLMPLLSTRVHPSRPSRPPGTRQRPARPRRGPAPPMEVLRRRPERPTRLAHSRCIIAPSPDPSERPPEHLHAVVASSLPRPLPRLMVPLGPFISTSHTPYLTSVDVVRKQRPGNSRGHVDGSRYRHACALAHSRSSVAIAWSFFAKDSTLSYSLKSTMASRSRSSSYTSSVPKYSGTDPAQRHPNLLRRVPGARPRVFHGVVEHVIRHGALEGRVRRRVHGAALQQTPRGWRRALRRHSPIENTKRVAMDRRMLTRGWAHAVRSQPRDGRHPRLPTLTKPFKIVRQRPEARSERPPHRAPSFIHVGQVVELRRERFIPQFGSRNPSGFVREIQVHLRGCAFSGSSMRPPRATFLCAPPHMKSCSLNMTTSAFAWQSFCSTVSKQTPGWKKVSMPLAKATSQDPAPLSRHTLNWFFFLFLFVLSWRCPCAGVGRRSSKGPRRVGAAGRGPKSCARRPWKPRPTRAPLPSVCATSRPSSRPKPGYIVGDGTPGPRASPRPAVLLRAPRVASFAPTTPAQAPGAERRRLVRELPRPDAMRPVRSAPAPRPRRSPPQSTRRGQLTAVIVRLAHRVATRLSARRASCRAAAPRWTDRYPSGKETPAARSGTGCENAPLQKGEIRE